MLGQHLHGRDLGRVQLGGGIEQESDHAITALVGGFAGARIAVNDHETTR